MERSDSITNLTAALVTAQGAFKTALKSRTNPFLKNKYATLDDVIAAVREPLSENGFSFLQPLTGNGDGFVLETILLHESGEWISCTCDIPHMNESKGANALQSFGASLTYMRRYMLASLLGITSDEDGDGDSGNGRRPTRRQPPVQASNNGNGKHWIDDAATRGKFWAWATKTMTLTEAEVHAALGVAHVKAFDGDKAAAIAKIEAWIDAEIKAGKRKKVVA